MNYYEKIIQEKMNSTQVVEKGTIKGAEYFIEKVTETVKYPRPFEQVRYIGKLKKDGRVIIYTPRHENLDTCKRALEKLVDENKSMFNNSKGETNMGYYADLIKQKQERQNAKPFYTLQGRELKTRSEVERYISDLEKEEREYFSYLRSYERKLEEAKNEPKPHSIGWADRISKYTDQIKSYKRSIERTDNWKSKAKEWISQNRNSKEEKDNDAAQTAYDYALKLAQQTGDPNFFKVLHRSREHFLANPGLIREWIDEMKGYMKKAGIKNSDDEKGYYAKLAEEKASRKH